MNRKVEKDGYTVSTEKNNLSLPFIHHYLSKHSYWTTGISIETVTKSIEGSLCFGIYQDNNQVGFARVITDCAKFGYLADVFIDEKYRGYGLFKWLMETIMMHNGLQGLRRFMLATRDAHTLYGQYGFGLLTCPERWMQIYYPDRYKRYGPYIA